MSDLSARPSSTLAITEKKPHIQRSGGCVGIFFQLFDWNRRFAKKKLFPKKLLPPVRTKVSKKFNAEEKLPVIKHLLIADEDNCREFPSKLKKNRELESTKHEMQAPGLVARLMGLEALPVSADEHDKSNKDSSKGKGERFGGGISNGLAKKDLSLSPEKGNVRPQKIQKTGALERKLITRFGAEALQIKNVLSRSRKHHHHHHHHDVYPKTVSPVKSPKTGRATSRLIDVATRILEPGIQTTNRARCSLAYSNSTRQQPWKDEVMNEVRGDNDLETKAACRNCGNMFEYVDMDRNHRSFNHNDEEKSWNAVLLDSNFSREVFFHDLEENRPRPAVYLENGNDVVLLKTRYQCLNAQPVYSRSQKKETIRNRTNQSPSDEQIPISRMFTSQKGASPSVAPKHRAQRRGQMLAGDRAPPKSKMATLQERRLPSGAHPANESKDFIALNRNVSRNRLKTPVKSDSSVEVDRRFCTGKGDSLATQRSPVRKRRNLNVNKEVDSAHAASPSGPSLEKQRSNNKINIVSGNGTKTRSDPVNHTSLRSRTANPRANKTPEVVSFTFNSPVKTTKGQTSDDTSAKRRDPNCSVTNNNLKQRLTTEENGVKQSSQNYVRMNGDALGALLEQKLKELSLQVENEAAAGFVPSARTTASILQELISALTAEKLDSCEVGSHVSIDTQGSQRDTKIEDSVFQANFRNKRSSDGFCRKADHFSPGCVLDASFSNDSCISSSIDDNSVKPMSSIDSDILDSASSTNNHRGRGVMGVTDIVNHASAVLQNVNRVHSRLTSTKLHYVQEIVVNAELLFGSNASDTSSGILDFLVGPFLDELESLVLAAWKNSIILGIEPRKDESPLRRFLFDCLVECLDVRYIRYSDSGFRALARLPKSIDAEVLIKVFDEEVRKWISSSGKTTDEIIETEMSTLLGKWTDFEIEAFETGAEIIEEVVQVLVDELVADLRF